jgi:hypothetical protein
MPRRLVFVVVVAVVSGALGWFAAGARDRSAPEQFVQAGAPTQSAPAAAVAPRRIALNTTPEDYGRLVELGYNVFDVGPSAEELDGLPDGAQGMIWVGDFSCGEGFGLSDEEFHAAVDELGDDERVYGWYIVDEPDPAECPSVPEAIRERADYIHEHAPGQVAFFSATDYEYGPLVPESTHADVVGFDPYPCRDDGDGRCDLSIMDTMIGDAVEAGFDRDIIAPVLQVFGTSCAENGGWRLPNGEELGQILTRWQELVPNPPLEITYTWGNQEEWACPTLMDADGTDGQPDLQSVIQQHNAAASGTTPAPDDPDAPDPEDRDAPECTTSSTTTGQR